MNKKLIQVEQVENEGFKYKKEKLAALIECATTIDGNGNEMFYKERFAELIVGECIAAALFAEVSLSSYMASLIEDRLGYKGNHFNEKWFINNWEND